MEQHNYSKLQTYTLSIISAALMVFLCKPAFSMTGLLIKPIVYSLFCGALISLLLNILKAIEASALSQIIFILYWVVYALIKEITLLIQNGFDGGWIEFFYFDKFLVIGSFWLGSVMFYCILRLFSNNYKEYEYRLYFRYSSVAFLIFYFVLLFYSFVLIRLQSGNYPFRFIPFLTIRNYIEHFKVDPYETLMNVLGNLFYFTPMGYIFTVLLRNKKRKIKYSVLIFFPLVAYTLLEFSQYIFQNGYCEFDDMAMNSIGFWLGWILCIISDKITDKISNSKFNHFWELN